MKSKQEWLEVLTGVLREAIPSARALQAGIAGEGPDLGIGVGNRQIMVELEMVRGPRISEVEGQLARAMLRLKRYAGEKGAVPVAVVALSSFGSKLENAVRAFMEEFAPEAGWALLDERGKVVLVIPDLDISLAREASLPEHGRGIANRGDRQLFTDLNRWMLKVLLLEHAPDKFWGGPRQRPRHPTELAKVADVSVAKAHNFAAAFEARGFLRKSAQGLRLVRVREILQSWLQDEKNASPKAVAVRALIPPPPKDGQAGEDPPVPSSAWDSIVLGGASAARQLGLLRIGGRQIPLVHARIPIGRALQEWQLEECEPRDAQMVLSWPMYPESVFRGQVCREAAPPLVDIWQVALDSISNLARGREQAEFILARVLAIEAPG